MTGKPIKRIKLNEKQFDKLVERTHIVSNIDDIRAGTADEFTIRYNCNLAAGKIQEAFLNSEPETLKLMQCVVLALMQISKEGADANTAFGLKKPHRRKNDAGIERTIALAVWKRVHVDGLKLSDAIKQVSTFTIGANAGVKIPFRISTTNIKMRLPTR